jgi:hypothetical protein
MYYFEYDKFGFLIEYKETDNNEILSHYILKGNSFIKIEEDGKYKSLSKYDELIQFKHMFNSGESWISIETKEDELNDDFVFLGRGIRCLLGKYNTIGNHHPEKKYPTIKRQINLEDNKLYNCRLKINDSNLNKWKTMISF